MNGVSEESVAAFYAAFKEKGIEPVISITERTVIRSVDRTALLRIFANILSNALKYSDGDLEITLDVTETFALPIRRPISMKYRSGKSLTASIRWRTQEPRQISVCPSHKVLPSG